MRLAMGTSKRTESAKPNHSSKPRAINAGATLMTGARRKQQTLISDANAEQVAHDINRRNCPSMCMMKLVLPAGWSYPVLFHPQAALWQPLQASFSTTPAIQPIGVTSGGGQRTSAKIRGGTPGLLTCGAKLLAACCQEMTSVRWAWGFRQLRAPFCEPAALPDGRSQSRACWAPPRPGC